MIASRSDYGVDVIIPVKGGRETKSFTDNSWAPRRETEGDTNRLSCCTYLPGVVFGIRSVSLSVELSTDVSGHNLHCRLRACFILASQRGVAVKW